jgi:hypothetical protein
MADIVPTIHHERSHQTLMQTWVVLPHRATIYIEDVGEAAAVAALSQLDQTSRPLIPQQAALSPEEF